MLKTLPHSPTRAEIDLDALAFNVAQVRRLAGKGKKIIRRQDLQGPRYMGTDLGSVQREGREGKTEWEKGSPGGHPFSRGK